MENKTDEGPAGTDGQRQSRVSQESSDSDSVEDVVGVAAVLLSASEADPELGSLRSDAAYKTIFHALLRWMASGRVDDVQAFRARLRPHVYLQGFMRELREVPPSKQGLIRFDMLFQLTAVYLEKRSLPRLLSALLSLKCHAAIAYIGENRGSGSFSVQTLVRARIAKNEPAGRRLARALLNAGLIKKVEGRFVLSESGQAAYRIISLADEAVDREAPSAAPSEA
jgi:hypothetical protein